MGNSKRQQCRRLEVKIPFSFTVILYVRHYWTFMLSMIHSPPPLTTAYKEAVRKTFNIKMLLYPLVNQELENGRFAHGCLTRHLQYGRLF